MDNGRGQAEVDVATTRTCRRPDCTARTAPGPAGSVAFVCRPPAAPRRWTPRAPARPRGRVQLPAQAHWPEGSKRTRRYPGQATGNGNSERVGGRPNKGDHGSDGRPMAGHGEQRKLASLHSRRTMPGRHHNITSPARPRSPPPPTYLSFSHILCARVCCLERDLACAGRGKSRIFSVDWELIQNGLQTEMEAEAGPSSGPSGPPPARLPPEVTRAAEEWMNK